MKPDRWPPALAVVEAEAMAAAEAVVDTAEAEEAVEAVAEAMAAAEAVVGAVAAVAVETVTSPLLSLKPCVIPWDGPY